MNVKKTLLALVLAVAGTASAQDAAKAPEMTPEHKKMMEAWEAAGRVGPEHERLKAFEGTWDAATSMWMDPSAPPEKGKGTAVTSSLFEGRFVKMDYSGEWNGQPFTGMALTGYDNTKKKYIGTWVDSMSTAVFYSEGTYDDASKTYTFLSEMHDPMAPGTMFKIRETVTMDSADKHTMTWYETRAGTPEMKTMEIVYTKRK